MKEYGYRNKGLLRTAPMDIWLSKHINPSKQDTMTTDTGWYANAFQSSLVQAIVW